MAVARNRCYSSYAYTPAQHPVIKCGAMLFFSVLCNMLLRLPVFCQINETAHLEKHGVDADASWGSMNSSLSLSHSLAATELSLFFFFNSWLYFNQSLFKIKVKRKSVPNWSRSRTQLQVLLLMMPQLYNTQCVCTSWVIKYHNEGEGAGPLSRVVRSTEKNVCSPLSITIKNNNNKRKKKV